MKLYLKPLAAFVPFGEASLSSSRRLALCFALAAAIIVTTAVPGYALAPQTNFGQRKASISEIKGWASDKIISSERELVKRFGHKGWGLILAQALSREMGTFKVPEFEIIEIGELWEPFYEANKEAIDKIIRINRLMRAFREALIDVYRRCKTREERRRELNKALADSGELVYLKELFGVSDLNGLEQKLCEEDKRHRAPLDFSDLGPFRDSSLQSDLNRIRAEIIWELDFNCLETVAKKHEGLISKAERIMYRTSATDEDTKDYANAGRYESRSSLGKYLDVVTENLRLIIKRDLQKLTSGDTGLAFILQDELPGKDIEGGIVFSNLYGYSAVELGQGISEPNGFEISPLVSATRGSQSMIVRIESGEIIEVLYNGIFKKGKNRLNHAVTTRDGVKHKITMPEEQLKNAAVVAKDIEHKLGYSVDIEFGVTKKDGIIYPAPSPALRDGRDSAPRAVELHIVQIRPVTADQSEGEPLLQFREEDIIAEFPIAINQCSAKQIKVVFTGGRYFGPYLNKVQEKTGYAGMVVCRSSEIELSYSFLYGEKLFWAGKSICKIGHDAINIRERAGKRNIVMGYFGDMNEIRERCGVMQEVLDGIFVSEEYFDIYSNGDRAVLVKAGAKPLADRRAISGAMLAPKTRLKDFAGGRGCLFFEGKRYQISVDR